MPPINCAAYDYVISTYLQSCLDCNNFPPSLLSVLAHVRNVFGDECTNAWIRERMVICVNKNPAFSAMRASFELKTSSFRPFPPSVKEIIERNGSYTHENIVREALDVYNGTATTPCELSSHHDSVGPTLSILAAAKLLENVGKSVYYVASNYAQLDHFARAVVERLSVRTRESSRIVVTKSLVSGSPYHTIVVNFIAGNEATNTSDLICLQASAAMPTDFPCSFVIFDRVLPNEPRPVSSIIVRDQPA